MSIDQNNTYTDGREPEEAAASSDDSRRCPNSPTPTSTRGAAPLNSPDRRRPPPTASRRTRGGRRGCGQSSPPSSSSSSPSSSPHLLTPPRQKQRRGKNPASPPHDAPMTKKDIYFALDCEMVGIGPDGLDSALARVTIVNYDEEIVLDKFVRVPVPVTDYRTFVSGVTKADIESDGAMPFGAIQKLVRSVLHGKILIGHGLQGDLKAIGISHPWCDIRDTASYAPYMREGKTAMSDNQPVLLPRKLRDLVWEELGAQIQMIGKAHSPIEDAVAALSLYKAARKEWEGTVMRQVNEARQLEQSALQQVHIANVVNSNGQQRCGGYHHHQTNANCHYNNTGGPRYRTPKQAHRMQMKEHAKQQAMRQFNSRYYHSNNGGRLSPPSMSAAAPPSYGPPAGAAANFRPVPSYPRHPHHPHPQQHRQYQHHVIPNNNRAPVPPPPPPPPVRHHHLANPNFRPMPVQTPMNNAGRGWA